MATKTNGGKIDLRDRNAGALAEERSLGELVSEVTADLSLLMRKEVELAKAEVRQEVRNVAQGGALFGAAGVLGLVGLIVLAIAGGFGLATVIATGYAFGAVGGLVVVGAAACALVGRKRLSAFTPVPEQTVETVKEDVKWARAQIS